MITGTPAAKPDALVRGSDPILWFAGILVFAYAVAVLSGPIVAGHDMYLSFSHVETWTTAMRAGDFMSVWTPAHANGFGSPLPFFYHKLFNLVAAALTIATGDIVAGFRLAILLFSGVMFQGVYRCTALLGASRQTRVVTAVACTMSPYALICIVERGAAAEYSAMALVPLCAAYAAELILRRPKPWLGVKLFVVLCLLALAHIVTFAVTAGLLAAFALALLKSSRRRALILLTASAGALMLFVILIYVPFLVWGNYFSPTQARLHGLPADNAVPLIRVLSPNPASWFGWPVLALLAALGFLLRHRKDKRAKAPLVTGLTALALILLTTRMSAPMWRLSAQLDFVQFPWRLLSIATPLIFATFAGTVERLPASLKRHTLFAILGLSVIHAAGMLYWVHGVFTTIPSAELRQSSPSTGPGPDAGGEYFPARYRDALAATPDILATGAASVLPARRAFADSTGGCTLNSPANVAYVQRLQIAVTCTSAGTARINQFDTPFLETWMTSNDNDKGGAMRVRRIEGGPMIEFALPPGDWTLHVRQRSYLELVGLAWRQKIEYDSRK
ncbi:6-pyruvoyl-tetrahydropterin synthase-related protein [Paraburkholderia diazotrophica]|uniref:6-pyruvoyl-tetrahydropterin synthase-related protein n=1 Tax=Paraburkholderia diazotrophica TaxID=667676 RepID=UPI00316CE36A